MVSNTAPPPRKVDVSATYAALTQWVRGYDPYTEFCLNLAGRRRRKPAPIYLIPEPPPSPPPRLTSQPLRAGVARRNVRKHNPGPRPFGPPPAPLPMTIYEVQIGGRWIEITDLKDTKPRYRYIWRNQ